MDKFVGRNTELTTLAQQMISSSGNNMRRKSCLLHGIGGVGKFQLAAEFALQDAARQFELVIQGYIKLLGPQHPEAVDASYRLKRCGDASSRTYK